MDKKLQIESLICEFRASECDQKKLQPHQLYNFDKKRIFLEENSIWEKKSQTHSESYEKARLPDGGVSNQEELEEVIAAEKQTQRIALRQKRKTNQKKRGK